MSIVTKEEKAFKIDTDNYREILQFYKLDFKEVEYYLQVGNIEKTQGWILHISVTISQVPDMLHAIVPVLATENVSFKIGMDREACSNLLNGHFGIPQIGKLVSIYAPNEKLSSLTQLLLTRTQLFKGPNVPTDFHLGTVIFTRYGSWNPVIKKDSGGNEEKYIYNSDGQLEKDTYQIPFQFPNGIDWPFNEIKPPILPVYKKFLNQIYKPVSVLKGDVKGLVFEGRYIKGVFHTATCVIKQGLKHMLSDEAGRDIHDRLAWQYHLHNELAGTIPLPKIIDFFQQEDHTYLVMEFVKGRSLFDTIKQLNVNDQCWRFLDKKTRIKILDYLLQLVSIIHKFHQKGYVHRDIQPTNFIVTRNDQLVMIDIELAWSSEKRYPNPPFNLGTPGFMSLEQQAIITPTIKEDIYGIGALMISLFTFLSPIKFNNENRDSLKESFFSFTGNKDIAELLVDCTDPLPSYRPDLVHIQKSLEKYKNDISVTPTAINNLQNGIKYNNTKLEDTITRAISGLILPPIVISNGLWYSPSRKSENVGTSHQKEYLRLPGLYEGLGGILYVLSRAKISGYNIESCKTAYNSGWEYIREFTIKNKDNLPAGLYMGTTGIAIAIANGIQACLLDNNEQNVKLIEQHLTHAVKGLDVATGIAGQGIAILQCKQYISEHLTQKLLKKGVQIIIENQNKDGSWLLSSGDPVKGEVKSIGFAYGITGITWYLLNYLSHYQETEVIHAATRAINYLLKQTNHLKNLFDRKAFKRLTKNTEESGDERTGIILTFIKAYEIFHDPVYKEIVEVALSEYSSFLVIDNFNQENGLAGLGEVYLEAAKVFNNDTWKKRSDWIGQVFINTAIQSKNGSFYWQTNDNNLPTADLMTGNSGIIHYLLRSSRPENVSYRLL